MPIDQDLAAALDGDPSGDLDSAFAILDDAITHQTEDTGAVFSQDAIAAWRHVQEACPDEFERLRTKAADAGARMAALDKAIKWKAPVVQIPVQPKPKPAFEGWQKDLITASGSNDSVSIPYRAHNLLLILRHAPEFTGRLRWNVLSDTVEIDGNPISETALTAILAQVEKHWITGQVHPAGVQSAILSVAHESPRDPIIEYLDSLVWDGIPRAEAFFVDYCGVPANDYHENAAKALFVSSVLRARDPGCQVDTMPILIGKQGIGKTRLWQALFGEWYAEVTESLDGKDFFVGLRGKWCCDFGELDQFRKADVTRVKQLLTIREDHYRAPYGRFQESHPRRNIFVGGTNSQTPLRDATGGRRFLPIHVPGAIDVDAVAGVRSQLWAEADQIARDPGRWWDVRDAEEHQEAVYDADSWEAVVGAWLKNTRQTTTTDVLRDALDIEVGKHTRSDQTRVGTVLRRLGWVMHQIRVDGARVRVYCPRKVY